MKYNVKEDTNKYLNSLILNRKKLMNAIIQNWNVEDKEYYKKPFYLWILNSFRYHSQPVGRNNSCSHHSSLVISYWLLFYSELLRLLNPSVKTKLPPVTQGHPAGKTGSAELTHSSQRHQTPDWQSRPAPCSEPEKLDDLRLWNLVAMYSRYCSLGKYARFPNWGHCRSVQAIAILLGN